MKIENLYEGQVLKNYKELCNALEIDVKAGKQKLLQMNDIKRYFELVKHGNAYKVVKVIDNPPPKTSLRGKASKINNIKYKGLLTENEMSGKRDGFYVYKHSINDEIIYIGKGSRRRILSTRTKYDINLVKKEIIKRFDDELEALRYEKVMIDYYKSIGQCKYNDDDKYTTGVIVSLKKDKEPKKISKSKAAISKLIELGYEFDECKGWNLK